MKNHINFNEGVMGHDFLLLTFGEKRGSGIFSYAQEFGDAYCHN